MLLSTLLLKSHFIVAVSSIFGCLEIGGVCVGVYKDASQGGHFF